MSNASVSEQYMLELINRERAEVGVQPLAFHGDLNESSALHSQWFIDDDTFSHTGEGGSTPRERMEDAGYQFTGAWGWGENIVLHSLVGNSGLQDDMDQLHSMLLDSPSHYAMMIKPEHEDVGIGVVVGEWRGFQVAAATENFAHNNGGADAYITGVVYDDNDSDNFYDIGEALNGLTVVATSAGGVKYTTTTQPAGGYAIEVPDGAYTVQLSSGGVVLGTRAVTVGDLNIKVDFITEPEPNEIIGTPLGDSLKGLSDTVNNIYGRDGNDVLRAGPLGDMLAGGNGNDLLYGGAGKDTIFGNSGSDRIWAGAGNDTIADMIGSNQFDGGAGNDTAVFTGAKSEYRVSTVDGLRVIGSTGNAILTSVETIKFSDGSYDVATGVFS
jgi:Ca2+-binding RTX toxin-like protein